MSVSRTRLSHGLRRWLCWPLFCLVCMGPWASVSAQAPLSDARIFKVLFPMERAAADRLLRDLMRAGLAPQWREPLHEMARTTEFGNSMPLRPLPTRRGHVCIAMGLRYDVDQVMQVSPDHDAATRQAVTEFLLVHEAAHCALLLPPRHLDGPRRSLVEPGLEDLRLLQEEARADQVARLAMQYQGRAGYFATTAWERYRLFGFLKGDLDHWTTPMLQSGLDAVADRDYRAMVQVWRNLIRAINGSEDGSAQQTMAWNAALEELPPSMRQALPPLAEIRALAREIWPQVADWRCKVTLRKCAL